MQLVRPDGTRAALGRRLFANFLQRAARQRRSVVLLNVPRRVHGRVLVLDQKPFVALLALLQLDEYKTSAQLLTVQLEFDLAPLQLLAGVSLSDDAIGPAVPDHHRPGPVVPLRNLSLEVAVVHGVVLGLDRQPLVRGIQRRPFGHRPGFQHALDRQPEVEMQAPRGVLLHHEEIVFLLGRFPCRLRSPLEFAFPPIFLKLGHRRILSQPLG